MLKIYTTNPNTLLVSIKKAIDEGHVTTWSYDADGDFTHTPVQWVRKAWLKPSVKMDHLQLNIIWPEGSPKSKEVYSVYHGRFIEMLLAHFDTKFTSAVATP